MLKQYQESNSSCRLSLVIDQCMLKLAVELFRSNTCFGRYTLSFLCSGEILGATDRRQVFAHGTRSVSHV